MLITGVRVKNFRTVGAQEQFLDLRQALTVIGPNNSGKTNLLQSVLMFFTGYDNKHHYRVDEDSPRGRGARTSIVGYFSGEPDGPDKAFYADLDRLYEMYGVERPNSTVTLYLSFSPTSNPSYNFFPNQKRPRDSATQSAISRLQKQLVIDLLGKFECHFIPSEKSMQELVDDVLSPFIRTVVSSVLRPLLGKIESELKGVSGKIDDALTSSGVSGISASFGFQGGSIHNMLSGFDFYLSDPYKTPLSRKGQGVQSLAFMAALHWVTEKESESNKRSIWLIEEPESFLHPELSHSATQLLRRLGDISTVVMTSHSMAFVPQDPKQVVGTKLDAQGETEISNFTSHEKATASLRRGLGVRFADYFSLGTSTVLTEGQTDSDYIRWFLHGTSGWPGCEWPHLREATISDRGGASHLAGFLRATYEVLRKEQPTVSLFDADSAGRDAVSGLSRQFNNIGVPFNANREYVYVRSNFAIEGLFPDAWVADHQAQHPGQFSAWQVDAANDLVYFSVHDRNKGGFATAMKARAVQAEGTDWALRWMTVCEALDKALLTQQQILATELLAAP